MNELTKEQQKDVKVLIRFIELFCKAKHRGAPAEAASEEIRQLAGKDCRLCPDCAELVAYAILKRRKCPLDPKPSCKHCHIHCYGKEQRQRIREVMAFSGKRMLMRGRLDMLYHYFF